MRQNDGYQFSTSHKLLNLGDAGMKTELGIEMKQGFLKRTAELVATLILGFFLTANIPSALAEGSRSGAKDGAGDFGHAEANLRMISFELAQQLQSRNQINLASLLVEAPELSSPMVDLKNVTTTGVAKVIGSIRMRFDENNDERFLFWGSDNLGVHIKAQRNFYIVFGDMPIQQWNEDRIMEVRARLLKEVSHTWGYNDRQGTKFAQEVLKEIYPSVPAKLYVEDVLSLERAKQVRKAVLETERDRLSAELYNSQGQLTKVDAQLTSLLKTHEAKRSSVNLSGRGDLVSNRCLDWAIKSWVFLGIGGVICAIDTATQEAKYKDKMDARFAESTESLRTEKATLEGGIVIVLQQLEGITSQLKGL